jgi:arylsulfatase A-like enzyme
MKLLKMFLLCLSSLLLFSNVVYANVQPNIVIIFADDLGYGDIGGFGQPPSHIPTPSLDRMADEGVRLTHCYVTVPYCAPSRASLLTGRYPFRHGLVVNPAPDAGINEVGLPDSEITIANALKDAGYTSICIGKWHLGHTRQYLPRRQGFDEYFGILYSNDMRPVQLIENEQVVEYPVIQADLTKQYTERTINFIQRSHARNQPFFLYLPHAMPHKPLAASEDFFTPDTPENLYEDVIRELDWSVGQILETIRSLGIDDNTLVIFLSDNGPYFGGSTGGLRGMKGSTWDGGIRVPMVARWPGQIPAGQVNTSIAGSIDIMPTVLKLAGVPLPDDRIIDGRDIWPLLTSESAESPHDALYAMKGTNLMTVRSGRWKLHVRKPGLGRDLPADHVDPRRPDGVTLIAPSEQARFTAYPGVRTGDAPKPMMLFDMLEDPSEQRDVAAQHPEIVARLKALFDATAAQFPEFPQARRGANPLLRIRGGALEYDP